MLVSPPERETRFGRVGLTVSRRVGGAVVRNRLKRRLREWYRRSALPGALPAGAPLDVVVIARPSAAGLSFQALSADLDALGADALSKATS